MIGFEFNLFADHYCFELFFVVVFFFIALPRLLIINEITPC